MSNRLIGGGHFLMDLRAFPEKKNVTPPVDDING